MPPPANRPGRVDPLIGSVVAGRYRIEARIASGGMGTVYRAEQLGLERKVALKLLHAAALEGTEDSQSENDFEVLEKRFSREAAILARLSHPNIVTIFDYGSVDEKARAEDDYTRPKFYMAMELLGGETLQERLSKRKRLSVEESIHLARHVARGLREAHLQGIVHRDLKPANIMIVRDRDGDELIKLLDFGIGKMVEVPGATEITDPRAELTQEGRFVGSPLYMAPEQIAHGHVDLRADVYSFGTVLYRVIAGVHPFHKDNTALVMLAHLHEQAQPLRERVPEVPTWLADLVGRCMAKEPDKRPASMEDVLRTLTEQAPASSGQFTTAPIEPLPPLDVGPTIADGQFDALLTPHTTTRPQTFTGTYSSGASGASGASAVILAKPRRAPLIAFGLATAIVVFVTVFFLARKDPQSIAAAAPPPPVSAKVNATFDVMIESVPSGAEVHEGDKLVGKTPVQISLPRDTEPHTYVISTAGYLPHPFVQKPSQEAVRVMAALQPIAAPPASTAPVAATVKPVVKKPAVVKPSATPPPLDIIPKR